MAEICFGEMLQIVSSVAGFLNLALRRNSEEAFTDYSHMNAELRGFEQTISQLAAFVNFLKESSDGRKCSANRRLIQMQSNATGSGKQAVNRERLENGSGGLMYHLIDTPGFDDTHRTTDLEVVQELLRWLPQVNEQTMLKRLQNGLEPTSRIPRSLILKANAQGSNESFLNQLTKVAKALIRLHRDGGDLGQDHRGWHADIKPQNILVSVGSSESKLADLGFSSFSSINVDLAERLYCLFSDKPSRSAISSLEQCAQYSWKNAHRFFSNPTAASPGSDYGLGGPVIISHIHGIVGAGKTTIARDFVASFQRDERYESIFWGNAEDWETLCGLGCPKQTLGSTAFQVRPSGGSKLGSPAVDTEDSVSRRYDVWSLGCVFIESLLFLLQRPTGGCVYERASMSRLTACVQLTEAYRPCLTNKHDTSKKDKPWDGIIDWMQHKGGCYWINGKTGSGKSTLMRYISQDVRSRTIGVDGLFSNHENECPDLMESKAGTANSVAYQQNLDLKTVHRPRVLAMGHPPVGEKGQLRCMSVKLANKRLQMARAIPDVIIPVTVFADDGDIDWPRQTLDCILGALYLERRNFDRAATSDIDGGVPCLSGRTKLAGADVDAKAEDGEMALMLALMLATDYGHEAVVRLLLEKGADVDVKKWDRGTALMRAAADGDKAVLRLLLKKGADVDAKRWDGGTALMRAAANGREAVVRLLLEKGADVDAYRYEKGDRHGEGTFAEARDLSLAEGSDRNHGDQGIGPQAGKPSMGREDDDDDNCVGFRQLSNPKYRKRTLQGDGRSFRRTNVQKYRAGDVHPGQPRYGDPYRGLVDTIPGKVFVHSPSASTESIWREAIARTCGEGKMLDPSPPAWESAGKEGNGDNSIYMGARRGGNGILCVH